MKLFHIYSTGRFGPEKHIGFVLADNEDCLLITSYIVFDIVNDTKIPNEFWSNPKSIDNINRYRRWQRTQTK